MSPVLGEQHPEGHKRRASPTQSDQVIGCTFFRRFTAGSFSLCKLSVNHQQSSFADNRRQFHMPTTKMNVYQNDHFVLFISFFYLPCQSSAVLYADNRRSKKTAPCCAGPSDYLEFMPRIWGYFSLLTGR
jgi:hypothetical protein